MPRLATVLDSMPRQWLDVWVADSEPSSSLWRRYDSDGLHIFVSYIRLSERTPVSPAAKFQSRRRTARTQLDRETLYHRRPRLWLEDAMRGQSETFLRTANPYTEGDARINLSEKVNSFLEITKNRLDILALLEYLREAGRLSRTNEQPECSGIHVVK